MLHLPPSSRRAIPLPQNLLQYTFWTEMGHKPSQVAKKAGQFGTRTDKLRSIAWFWARQETVQAGRENEVRGSTGDGWFCAWHAARIQ